MTLSDYPPHALIAGPSGTGKTNLIYAWMGALAARYSPAELAFYLLDFKEGVSFARFAPGRRDPSWLPHVRLVGVNVNTDREFGLALLRFLGDELRRRADAAKQYEVTNLAELRAEDPDGHVAADRRGGRRVPGAALRAGRGRRRGRRPARGPGPARPLAGHPPGAGQPGRLRHRGAVGPAGAGRPVLAADRAAPGPPGAGRDQPGGRVAAPLPRGGQRRLGRAEANRIVRVPAAGDRESWSALQHRLWRHRPQDAAARRGCSTATRSRGWRTARTSGGSRPADAVAAPVVLLGETIDVAAALGAYRAAPGARPQPGGARHPGRRGVRGAGHRGPVAGRPVRARRRPVLGGLPGHRRGAPRSTRCAPTCPATPASTTPTTSSWLLEDPRRRPTDAPARPAALPLPVRGGRRARGTASSCAGSCGRARNGAIHVLGWWRGAALLRDTLGGQASRTDADRRLGGAGRARQRAGAVLPRARARRPGIRGRGGRCTSTARCTAAPR